MTPEATEAKGSEWDNVAKMRGIAFAAVVAVLASHLE